MDYCKKPCYDCPFRSDVRAYQTRENARNNCVWTILDDVEAIGPFCHHTIYDADGVRIPDDRRRLTLCAGGILFRRQLGLPDKVPVAGVRAAGAAIFRSLDDLTLRGPCVSQHPVARFWAWWANQPAGRRERLLRQPRLPGHPATTA